MDGPIEFVFSLRSPFAWVAARHVLPQVDPAVEIRWCPFYPLPSFRNFGNLVPARARYNIEDLLRLGEAYGLTFGRPPIDEPDWSIPHAAFVWADRKGKGAELGRLLLAARWADGKTLASADTIRDAARAADLDPEGAVAASQDEALRSELTAQVQANYDERDIFGVPMFVLPDGKKFWGHDRMEWAIRHGFVPSAA